MRSICTRAAISVRHIDFSSDVTGCNGLGHGEAKRRDRQSQGKGRSGLQVVLHQWVSTAFTIPGDQWWAHHLIGGVL